MENKKKENYRYLFGPVPSRRFGRSLGIDLTPFKTCCLDCVFCQLGRTRETTIVRKEHVPVDAVFSEIEEWRKTDGKADYITLSGSGEPTLHSGFGNVLKFLQKGTIPTVLLTNGTLLNLPEVQDAAMHADIVKVSLSAWDHHSFKSINRPHGQLQFDEIVKGQKAFRAQFKGKLWMEVFVLLGMNSMPRDIKKIAAQIKKIKPDHIHLNTVVRPPAESFAGALPEDRMIKLTDLFDPIASVIAEYSENYAKNVQITEDTILAMLQRRPCTMEQIAKVFGMHINEVSKYLGKLTRNNLIHAVHRKKTIYYTILTNTLEHKYSKKDTYSILEVDRNAGNNDIKK